MDEAREKETHSDARDVDMAVWGLRRVVTISRTRDYEDWTEREEDFHAINAYAVYANEMWM